MESLPHLAPAEAVMGTLLDAGVDPQDPQRDRDLARVHAALFGGDDTATQSVPTTTRFGRYETIEKIGEGAMGEVYRAVDTLLERQVAIKIVHRRLAARADRGIPRLLQEAKSMAKLRHPSVVGIYEAGIDDGQAWIAMEYVAGSSLRDWLGSAPRSSEEILRCLIDAGRGLAAAHSVGLVHRDFKPDNVLVDAEGRARVGDFGLVRPFQERSTPSQPTSDHAGRPAGSGSMTREGAIVGTPAYMPPEQLAGDPLDGSCDQFAFCVTAWEALFGVRPFAGGDPIELCAAILAGNLRKRRSSPGVSRRVEKALRRGMAARASERFGSMDELLGRMSGRPGRWVALAAGAAVAGGIGVPLFRAYASPSPCDGAEANFQDAWSESAAERLDAAIRSTGVVYAASAADAVRTALDARRDAWVNAWRSTCSARVAGVESTAHVDRRAACLQARRADTPAVVRRLSAAEAGTLALVAHAQDAIAGLPSVDSCSHVDTDQAIVPEAVRDELDPLVANARALRLAGESAAALVVAQAGEFGAQRLESPGHLAETRLELGRTRLALGDVHGAATSLNAAVDAAVAADDEALQAQAWLELAQLAANEQRDPSRAGEWLDHGTAVTARVEHADALELRRDLVRSYLTAISDPEQALAMTERIADGVEVEDPERGRIRDEAARAIAPLLLDLSRFEEAQTAYRSRIARDIARYGPDHPKVADGWYGLGIALDRQGSDDADSTYRRALQIWTAAWPAGHRDIGAVHIGLANVAQRQGKFATALERANAAMEMYQAVLRPDDVAFAEAWTAKGVALHRLGRLLEAALCHDEARRIYSETTGKDSVNVAISRSNAAEARVTAGLGGQGPEFQAAYEVIAKAYGEDSPILGYPLKGLGMVAALEGRADAASSLREQSRRICTIDPIECEFSNTTP